MNTIAQGVWRLSHALAAVGSLALWAFSSMASAEGTFPLRVSPNGRYLVSASQTPYLLFADTGWMLFANLSDTDVKVYLDDRKSKGFNSVLAYIAPFKTDAPNKAGHSAFHDRNLAAPNDAYFEHVDWVLAQAAARDMQLILCPAEMDSAGELYTADKARKLGRYLGQRYQNVPNIIWFTGGDIAPEEPARQEIARELAIGIREQDKRHLITMHPRYRLSSSKWFHRDEWLGFNMYQTFSRGSTKAYVLARSDYALHPVKPTWLAEPNYEGGKGENTAYDMRTSAGWSFFSGTLGIAYGADKVWMFDDPGQAWKNNLNMAGAWHLSHMVEAIRSRPWYKLVPDFEHKLVTDGYGEFGKSNYAAAALAGDGSFAMAYLPDARSMTIDMGQFNSGKTVKWFDPTSNAYTVGVTHPNRGSLTLPPRPPNSAGQSDWILVIE